MTDTTAAYRENYDRIAKTHVAYAQANNGENPFMPPDMVERFEQATVDLVRRHVTPGAVLLDAGCGPGTLLARLGDYAAIGCDMSNDYLEYAEENVLDGSFPIQCCELESLPYRDRLFEAIVCADVLEHVLDEHAVLRELVRVLKPGGHLIIRVPWEQDLDQYLNGDYDYVHLRKFDPAALQLLLGKIHGLDVLEVSPVEYPVWDELHAVATKPL